MPYDGRVYSDTARVIVDTDAPAVRLSAPENGAILRRDPSGTIFNVGGSSGDESSWVSRVSLSVNGTTAASFDNPAGAFVHSWQLPNTDGDYTLLASATDFVGETRASAPVRVTVDGTAPSANLDLAQFSNINGRSFVRAERGGVILLDGAASDATAGLASVLVSIDGRPYKEVLSVRDPITAPAVTAGNWSLTWTLPLTDSAPDGVYPAQGAHTIALRALDRAGNISEPPAVTIVVDIAPPSSDLTTNAYGFTPTVRANVPLSLTGRANDLGNLPLPARAARLQGGLDSVYSATLWLQLESQRDSGAGVSMTWLGDVNGDGRNDLAVGTPAAADGAGRISVVYGRSGDYRVPPQSEAVFDSPSTFTGAPGAGLGALLSAIGDVNGDGLYDMALGDAANQRIYLVFGRTVPFGSATLLPADASGAHSAIDLSGLGALRDVRGAGDVNRDGNDDVLVSTASGVYLLLGQTGAWQSAINLDAQAAASHVVGNASAAGVGDVDGDGFGDFAIGAAGAISIVRGDANFAPRARETLQLGGARVLASFASADATPRLIAPGDVNGDGKADFVYSNGSSPALVLGGAPPTRYAGALPTASGFIAAPGDVNGDGLADLLLGNTADASASLLRGSRAIVAGSSAPLVAAATFANVLDAASAPYASGGDLNCDQASDVLLLPSRAPAISQAQTSAYGRAASESPDIAAFDVARLPAVSTAYSATWPAPASNVAYVGCPGCFATIQAAISAAAANTRIIVLPGVYDPFVISGIGKNGLSIEGAGAGADQVIIDGAGGAHAAEIRDVRGVSLNRVTLRNARVGVRVVNAGNAGLGGAVVQTSTIRFDSLLVHNVLSSTLDLDRISVVDARNSTLLGTPSQPLIGVDTAPDPAYAKTWDARAATTLQAHGSLATADDGSAQPPIYALNGGTALSRFDPVTNTWTAKAAAPVSITAGSSNLVANPGGSQLFVIPSQTWNGLGRGVNGPIRAIVKHDNCIVVAGAFTTMTNADGSTVASNVNYGLGCFNLTNNRWQAITILANNASSILALAVAGSANDLYIGGQLKRNGGAYGLERCAFAAGAYTCTHATPNGFSPGHWPTIRAFSTTPSDPNSLWVYGIINNAAAAGCTGAGEGTQGILFWNLSNNYSGIPLTCDVPVVNHGASMSGAQMWTSPSRDPVNYPGDWLWGCLANVSCQNPPGLGSGVTRSGAPASINTLLLLDNSLLYAGGNFDTTFLPGPCTSGNCTPGWAAYQWRAADSAFYCTTYTNPNGFKAHTCNALNLPGAPGTPVSLFARGSGSGNIYAARGSAILRQGAGSWTEIARFAGTVTVTSIDDILVNGVTQLIVGGTFGGAEATPASPNIMLNYASVYTYSVTGDTWTSTPFPGRFGARPLMWQAGTALDMVIEDSTAVYRYVPGSATLSARPGFPNTAAIGTAIVTVGSDVYAVIGGTGELYRQRANVWTALANAPFAFGSGASLAFDGIGSLYATQGGGGAQFARYKIAGNAWGPADSIAPDTFRINSGGGFVRSGDALFAARGNGVSGFARYSKLLPQPLKLTLNTNAFFAPRAATNATLASVLGQDDDYGVTLNGNQFVDGGAGATTWTPAATSITRASVRLVNEDASVFRSGVGSTLSAGYYTRRDSTHALVAYVAPTYCAACANEGRVWGIDAFASIQAAINSGAQRVLLAPGVYVEAFQLANGVNVIGAGAENTLIRPPAGWTGPLVTADGVSQAGLSRVTLDGETRAITGFHANGAADARLTRSLLRNMATAIVLTGASAQAATDVEISNVTLVQNTRAIDQSGNALLDVRNSIVAFNSDGVRFTNAAPRLEYNLYFRNGAPDGSDVNGGAPSGPGEITQDPLFVNSAGADFRLLPESPAIDAGNPGDPTPPSIGGRVDLGYVERAQAAFFADDDYGQNALNDGLTWQVDAFATVGDALNAAQRHLSGRDCQTEQNAREARGICDARVIVGVGPGIYTETVRVPSYVRLIGSGAESSVINANGQTAAVRIDGAIRSEVSGLTLIGANGAGIDVISASNGIVIERTIVRKNGAGVRVSGGAEALIQFNTIVSNTVGVEASGANTFAQVKNSILARNGSGISVTDANARASSSHNLLNSTVLDYGAISSRVLDKEGDLVATTPGFVNEAAGDYRLTATSLAVDSAAGADAPPLGGGAIADRGYAELSAIPLTLFLGQSTAPMCTTGNAGVAAVEVGLSAAPIAALPLTATLPAAWQRLTFATPMTATYWTASVTPVSGPQRLYSRGEDALGNSETPITRYSDNFGRRLDQPKLNIYDGALIGDADAPVVTLVSPAADVTSGAAALVLRATVTGTQDGVFDIAEPFFEIDGARIAAEWVTGIDGQPREYRASISLPDGAHVLRAGAIDKAGNTGRSGSVTITISAGSSGASLRAFAAAAVRHSIAIISPVDGAWTNKSTLRMDGAVRFGALADSGGVRVQSGAGVPVDAVLADRFASLSNWSADIALSEGANVITATANNGLTGTTAQASVTVNRDTVLPVLTTQAGGALVTRTVEISGSVSDAHSGVAAVDVSVDGGLTWLPAALSASTYRLSWQAPQAEQNTSYPLRIRARDVAGNERIATLTVVVDNLPPDGIDPVEFNIPIGSHLDVTSTLVMSWTSATDNSNAVTVTAAIDQSPDALPVATQTGTTFVGALNADGAWYAHVSATDRAGNQLNRAYGPWHVGLGNLCFAKQSIALDGMIELDANEWRPAEFIDDDERSLISTAVGARRERQSLYATWDADAFYLGWHGAWWDIDGAMVAYLDTDGAASGGTQPVFALTPTVTLPFSADWAVVIDGLNQGTLYRFENGAWVARGPAQFGHSTRGDTEIRIQTPIRGLGTVRALAYATTATNAAWSVFPTTNPLSGPWTATYTWGAGGSICDTNTPGGDQPRATSLNITLESPQPTHIARGAGETIDYRIRIENLEALTVSNAGVTLTASGGLSYRDAGLPPGAICVDCASGAANWRVALPDLAPGARVEMTISATLAASLAGIDAVTNTVSSQPAALGGERSLAHRIDSVSPSVDPAPAPAGAVRPGTQILLGSADDAGGSGLQAVEIRRVGAANWQPVTGTLSWEAAVALGADADALFEIRARDGVGNLSPEILVRLRVDASAPAITFTAPALVGGLPNNPLVIDGVARDSQPEDSQVSQVRVQIIDPTAGPTGDDAAWIDAFGPYSPTVTGGEQAWRAASTLPDADGAIRHIRASAADAAGNLSVSEWQTMTIDTVAPVISMTNALTTTVADYGGIVLSGTLRDGMTVVSSTLLIYAPDGTVYTETLALDGDAWAWSARRQLSLGTYRLRVQASDRAGNSSIAGPFTLEVIDASVAGLRIDMAGAPPAYIGAPITFTANASGTNLSYVWDFGDGATATGALVTHAYTALGARMVVVTVTNTAGAQSGVRTLVVVDRPASGLNAAHDGPTTLGYATLFSATITSGENVSFVWDFGDGQIGAGAVVSHTYAAPGQYSARVTAINSGGEAQRSAPVLILDTPTLSFEQPEFEVDEGAGAARITMTLDIPASVPISARIVSADESATAGADYDALDAVLTFAPGELTRAVTLTVSDDALDELAESVGLSMTETSVAQTGAPARLRIFDNDGAPSVRIASALITVSESAPNVVVMVTLDDAPTALTATVRYETQDRSALAASDYVSTSGVLTFAPGVRTGSVIVLLRNDDSVEETEDIALTLSAPENARLDTPSAARIRVLDDDKRFVHLPIVLHGVDKTPSTPPAPDLVVRRAVVTTNTVSIVIENAGTAAVTDAFWVDLYIDPNPPPRGVNDVWSDGRSVRGAVWGIDQGALPIQPGAQLTLTLSSPFYRPELSSLGGIANGVPFAVQVDAASTLDPVNGAVRETHELAHGPYNNIARGTVGAATP